MARITLADHTFDGSSEAGIGTAMAIKELKLCFDLGTLPPMALSSANIFLSHGHTDHCGELFNYLAIRALEQRPMATIFGPPELIGQLATALEHWQQLSHSRFNYRLVQCYPGAPVPLRNNTTVTAFPLAHEPATLGFVVQESVRKLKPEYNSLPAYEIGRRRKEGDNDLFSQQVRPLVAYVPDTLPEGLDTLPEEAWAARVLAVEATFLDDRKPIEKVRKGRHLVLDDILERLHRFSGEHILLFHFSRIYTHEEVRSIVHDRVPEPWLDRIHLFL